MLRKKEDQQITFRCIREGIGETEIRSILNDENELNGHGRLFAHMILEPGRSIGDHTHENDFEAYYILSGSGEYDDNGTKVVIGPGDTAVCAKGEHHSLFNNTDKPIELIALVLY